MKPLVITRNLKYICSGLAIAVGLTLSSGSAQADVTQPVIGDLLFEENFNQFDTTRWNTVEGDGCQYGPDLCGWGNNEKQYYGTNNVRVEDVPSEMGNKALVLEARNEAMGSKFFTSGKVDSKDKIAVKYGMIEYRVRVPDVGVGLWPAVWMLGTSAQKWPLNGEIDMMEMGHSAEARAQAGHAGAQLNSYVGGNAIFYAEAACHPTNNPTCAASTAWQADNAYVSPAGLTNRFITYRTYWTDTQLRFTVLDNGVEHDMYNAPISIGAEATELQAPFYLLLNLAVGGNFTDAATESQVTAPIPAKMYIDYIKVYQLNGMGSVSIGNQTVPETGTFGVFTDTTPTNNKLEAGVTSDIHVWNTASVGSGNTAAYEGSEVIAWNYHSPNQWFGGGIPARHKRDMSGFVDGYLKFRIKIPANVSFKIGIADTYTNENWVTFFANQTTYGLVRNGAWAQATIPVSVLRGSNIALQSMLSLFNIASVDGQLPASSFQMAIDDIVWTGGAESTTSSSSTLSSSSSVVVNSSSHSSSSVASSTSIANPLGVVQISPLTGGSVKFSIRVSEEKETVHLFTRHNGNQNYEVIELQNLAGSEMANGDGTFTYQVTRSNAYAANDLIEARFYTYKPSSGQVFYPGPGHSGWTSITYQAGASSLSSSSVRSSSSSVTPPSSAASTGDVQISPLTSNTVKFSIRLSEEKDQVHLFARRNGEQDYVINDLQNVAGAKIANSDGTFTYQVIRTYTYTPGNLIEARFFTNKVSVGQKFYPGPGESNWTSLTYIGVASSSVPSPSSSSKSSSSVATTSSIAPGSSSISSSSSSSIKSSSSVRSSSRSSSSVDSTISPLYNAETPLERAIVSVEDRAEGKALVTRISDRGRNRHAKENHFQNYDIYKLFYWEQRTASIEIIDYVAFGGTKIRMNVVSQAKLSTTEAENRWWYTGKGTLAEYCGNGVMTRDPDYNDDFHYFKESTQRCHPTKNPASTPQSWPIKIGDKLEFEVSQFLHAVIQGQKNYYGTTYLYIVGEGLVPWDVTDRVPFVKVDAGGEYRQRDSIPIPVEARLGGDTSLHAEIAAEPDHHFQQMANNLGYGNAQPFVLGRRIHHTSFDNGSHDEHFENGVFTEMVGVSGSQYVNDRCAGCHIRNGRAPVADLNEPLDKWVFKVGDASGNPHPDLGRVFQPNGNRDEGSVAITNWVTTVDGLRKPQFSFIGPVIPEVFSARLTPQLVGMGLLEAIPESTILANEDIHDADDDGISGKAQRIYNPVTGNTNIGRFGYKAATASVKHQVAVAFNTDMGVMTRVPDLGAPDCGERQLGCNTSGKVLDDAHLDNLVKYISLLGVRPQRNYNDSQVKDGKALFNDIGCAKCHTATVVTSAYHPFAELRSQTIHPYTDLLLHDMGEGLADTHALGEGQAEASEWRTAPLWNLGLSACVTGGITGIGESRIDGVDGLERCAPKASYLHDGRASTIHEAILWHGGEGQDSNDTYQALGSSEKANLLKFLESL